MTMARQFDRVNARYGAPLTATLERYGCDLRIYDNGGKTLDRYTAIPPRWARAMHYDARRGLWDAVGSGADPRGVSGHCDAVPGPHLGKRVHWDDLPEAVQSLFRASFANFAPLAEREVTYHRPPTPGEIRFGEGATHYRDFNVNDVRVRGTTRLKKWFTAADDGLRYYY